MGSRVFFFLLILSPLLYSFDGDDLREEKVIAVAILAVLYFLMISKKQSIYGKKEIIIIGLFSFMAVLQQFFIVNGSVVYGVKYAITLLSSFIPYWIARTLGTEPTNDIKFEKSAIIAIMTLFLITTTTIFLSYLLGWGEVHQQSGDSIRAFGWLGDSFTPVIVFLILISFLLKNYLMLSMALIALLMTGGKAAIGMLILSPILFVFSAFSTRIKIMLVVFYLSLLFLLTLYATPIIELISENPRYEASYNTRILSIYIGLEYFYDNPVFGVGVIQSMKGIETDVIALAREMRIVYFYQVTQIHNTIIRIAAEVGVFGLVLLLYFYYIVLKNAFFLIKNGKNMPNTRSRYIVLASSVWVVSFILVYQTTGWFEPGHPQLSWLLTFSTLSEVFYRRWAISNKLS